MSLNYPVSGINNVSKIMFRVCFSDSRYTLEKLSSIFVSDELITVNILDQSGCATVVLGISAKLIESSRERIKNTLMDHKIDTICAKHKIDINLDICASFIYRICEIASPCVVGR